MRVFPLISLFAVLACGDDATVTEPPVPVASRVEVEPTYQKLTELGQTTRLTARVFDQFGEPMTGQRVTWRVAEGEAVSLAGDGTLRAVEHGVSRVAAHVGGASHEVMVQVALPPTDARIVGLEFEATSTSGSYTIDFYDALVTNRGRIGQAWVVVTFIMPDGREQRFGGSNSPLIGAGKSVVVRVPIYRPGPEGAVARRLDVYSRSIDATRGATLTQSYDFPF